MANKYPTTSGTGKTRYTTYNYGSKSRLTVTDLCTRKLSYPHFSGCKADVIRFDYAHIPGWEWKRAHVLFLRELFRAVGLPDSITRQVTVPNLSNPDKGVLFHTKNHPGPVILLAHSLIRDMYECPNKAWVAYFVWRSGFNALDSYNFASYFRPSRPRTGKIDWSDSGYNGSQAIDRTSCILVPIGGRADKMVCYKETGRLSDPRIPNNVVVSLMDVKTYGYILKLANAIKKRVRPTDGDKYVHHFMYKEG